MRRLLLIAAVVCLALPAWGRQRYTFYCQQGGVRAYVSNVASLEPSPTFRATYWVRSFPSATATVYTTGTLTLATLYSDNSSTPKANPFTVDSVTGYGMFYADNGRYDVQCSDTLSPVRFTTFTIGDILLCDPADAVNGCGPAAHNLLSTTHTDTLAATVVRGDMIVGNSTPKWARVAKGTANQMWAMDGTGTDPGWVTYTQRHVCMITVGDDDGAALTDAKLGPQGRRCFIPKAATVLEITVAANDGTPQVIVGNNHAGSVSNLVSSALATAASGGLACSNTGGTAGLDGATTCAATLQNTAIAAGDWIELVSGTAGGTAARMSIAVSVTW